MSIAVVCALLGLVGAGEEAGAQLPPDIQADRYLLQAEGHIREGRHEDAKAALDRVLALQTAHNIELPDAFWFKYAKVCNESGAYADAVQAVLRYLTTAGRDGEHYGEALELLNEAETMQKAAAVIRRAAENPGQIFRECRNCPEMVVIPAGSFRMGCVSGQDCEDDEKLVHRVRISEPFALGRTEVAFAQWDACVADGGCDVYRDDQDWGRGSRPVIRVSWDDANAYVSWLSGKTGAEYRLPSEAEWEYAARAGTTTAYSWGNSPSGRHANGAEDNGWPNDGYREMTAPVGSFEANPFGLHDMHGNVWEWVGDCWNGNYDGAPSDGSAWESGDCSLRVLRGGSWYGHLRWLRSADRNGFPTGVRDNYIGFRVARTLAP